VEGAPVKGLTEGKHASGGATSTAHNRPLPRRRAQACLSPGGFQAPHQIRRAGDGGAAGIRPNRTAFIALLKYQDGELAYILAPQRLKAATRWWRATAPTSSRQCHAMAAIPVGTIIHNIELKPGAGGKLARSAGTFAQLVARMPAMRR